MNRGWKGVAAFFCLWILLTAALFPVVWGGVTVPAVRGVIEGWAPGSLTAPRVFGRVVLVVALVLVPALLWFWKDGPKRFFSGLPRGGRGMRILAWFFLGFFMVAAGAWLQELLGVRNRGAFPGPDLWAGALASGCLVAVLEEFFFRGVLGLAFWKAAGEKPAALLLGVNAAVFAAAHFLRPIGDVPSGPLSGFAAWANLQLWAGPADPWKLAGLFVAGLILARLAWQQQNLWAAIGLHAGWVAGMRFCREFWRETPGVSAGWWGPSLEAGPIPFVLLLLVAFAVWGQPIRARLD